MSEGGTTVVFERFVAYVQCATTSISFRTRVGTDARGAVALLGCQRCCGFGAEKFFLGALAARHFLRCRGGHSAVPRQCEKPIISVFF
jgi:hypothetical protein